MVGFRGKFERKARVFNPTTQRLVDHRTDNRPNSIGYNPVHKDIYEAYDSMGEIV